MIPLLLALTPAWGGDDATMARLFGEPDAAPPTASEGPSGWRLLGPSALAGLGLLVAWRWRRPTGKATPEAPIVLLGRQPLGDRSALVLVEVVEPDGERRRLLVGTGGQAPTLVADLGCALTDVVEAELAERLPFPRRARP